MNRILILLTLKSLLVATGSYLHSVRSRTTGVILLLVGAIFDADDADSFVLRSSFLHVRKSGRHEPGSGALGGGLLFCFYALPFD